MQRTVILQNIEGKDVEIKLLSTGTTAYRYRQIFRKDLMPTITKIVNEKKELDKEQDLLVGQELAFIMCKQAEKRDMNTVTLEEYYNWIEQFDSSSLFKNIAEFIQTYTGSKQSLSEPKKNEEP